MTFLVFRVIHLSTKVWLWGVCEDKIFASIHRRKPMMRGAVYVTVQVAMTHKKLGSVNIVWDYNKFHHKPWSCTNSWMHVSTVIKAKIYLPIIQQHGFTYCPCNLIPYLSNTNLKQAKVSIFCLVWNQNKHNYANTLTCTWSIGPDSGSRLRWITIPLSHLFMKCALPLIS